MTSDKRLSPLRVIPVPLTVGSFAPFGQVLEPGAGRSRMIRDDTVRLTHTPPSLAHADQATCAQIDIYEVAGEVSPVICSRIERHPLSAQMFVPQISAAGRPGRWLVAIWPEGPDGTVHAFTAKTGQGVVYKTGIWHQGIVALDAKLQFLSMMFRGEGTRDTEFHDLSRPVAIEVDGP